MEKRPLGKPEAPTGEKVVTCTGAERATSAAGNRCIRWTLQTGEKTYVDYWTVVRRAETGLMAQALGIPLKPLRLADAAGKQCRAMFSKDGDWLKISGVRPL